MSATETMGTVRVPGAENPLVSGPILPALLWLTIPNLAAMLVTALVAICETVYVGILGTAPFSRSERRMLASMSPCAPCLKASTTSF